MTARTRRSIRVAGERFVAVALAAPYHHGYGRRPRCRRERLVAVVLFTDLVASTELRAQVGEEAAEELRRSHGRLQVRLGSTRLRWPSPGWVTA